MYEKAYVTATRDVFVGLEGPVLLLINGVMGSRIYDGSMQVFCSLIQVSWDLCVGAQVQRTCRLHEDYKMIRWFCFIPSRGSFIMVPMNLRSEGHLRTGFVGLMVFQRLEQFEKRCK